MAADGIVQFKLGKLLFRDKKKSTSLLSVTFLSSFFFKLHSLIDSFSNASAAQTNAHTCRAGVFVCAAAEQAPLSLLYIQLNHHAKDSTTTPTPPTTTRNGSQTILLSFLKPVPVFIVGLERTLVCMCGYCVHQYREEFAFSLVFFRREEPCSSCLCKT